MSKSVYSIVLDDEIINQIDILSNRQGTSRSNMINRILARHVSVPTAETMVNDVFKYIDEFIQRNSSLAVQPLGSGSLINMRSALKYKYKPTIKYTVELFENGDYRGQMKVTMRSQNVTLINILNDFFNAWAASEVKHNGVYRQEFDISDGRYTRLLRKIPHTGYREYGKLIAKYADLMDRCMKTYFEDYATSPTLAKRNTEKLYVANITKDIVNL